MRAAIEISMYPLAGDYRPPIQAFIDRLNTHPDLTIMSILTEEMTRSAAAAGAPQLVFVLKVLPGLDPPEAAPGVSRT